MPATATETLTLETLTRLGACELARAAFTQRWPAGEAPLNEVVAALAEAGQVGWWGWLGPRVPALAPTWKAYREAEAPARRAYLEAIDVALVAYEEVVAGALAAYWTATTVALREIAAGMGGNG